MDVGRMISKLTVTANGHRKVVGGLVDTGAGITVLANVLAVSMGIETSVDDHLFITGARRSICYRRVDLHIPGTDCLVEQMRVAVIAKPSHESAFLVIVGADFLQRTGAFLDFRKGRHAIGADPSGRDDAPPEWVEPRRMRLRKAR